MSTWKKAAVGLILCAIAALALGPSGTLAQGRQEMALTGTFQAAAVKGASGTYTIIVRERELNFQVTNAELKTPQAEGLTGLGVLDQVPDRRITLYGNDKDMKRLLQPDVPGKRFLIKGTLYVAEGTLLLISLTEPGE